MEPSGGFLRTTLRRFFGSSPAFASAFSFSTTCSGACTTTRPSVSKPARPAPPAVRRAPRGGGGRGGRAAPARGARAGAGAAGAAGVLVELPGAQHPGPLAVVLAQPGEEHGADRHV